MVTTINILDLLKEKFGSDYKTAQHLGISRKRVSQLRHDGGSLTDEQGLKAAELLDFPKEFIILSLAAERSFKSPAHRILAEISEKFDPRKAGAIAACTLIAIGSLSDGIMTKLAFLAV
jgi:plasmid maintenance system antidote protein VapI